MSAGTIRTQWARLRWRVMPATVVLAGAGLGLMGPAPHAAAAATMADSSASRAGSASLATAYVVNASSGTVTPISTATNTAGPPITVGSVPFSIAITPDGKTAYVANDGSGTVTPISTATNTAGPPITTGDDPYCDRDHTGRQDRLRRQPRLGHGDADRRPPPTPPGRRSRSEATPMPSRSPRTARPSTSPTRARAR